VGDLGSDGIYTSPHSSMETLTVFSESLSVGISARVSFSEGMGEEGGCTREAEESLLWLSVTFLRTTGEVVCSIR